MGGMEELTDLTDKIDPDALKESNGPIGGTDLEDSIELHGLIGPVDRTNLIVLAVVDVANSLYKNGRTILKAL